MGTTGWELIRLLSVNTQNNALIEFVYVYLFVKEKKNIKIDLLNYV